MSRREGEEGVSRGMEAREEERERGEKEGGRGMVSRRNRLRIPNGVELLGDKGWLRMESGLSQESYLGIFP